MVSVDRKPPKTLILNAFICGAPSEGFWTAPTDTSREFTRSLDYWIDAAKLAERGKLNSIFVADHLTLFDDYGSDGVHGNYRWPIEKGALAPRIDPGALLGALAQHTESIGFGITFSTVSEHPYHFARRLASFDHFTNGRVGWNVVSSYLNSIGRQLLNGAPLPEHDERYAKTSEYVEVVYDLLLSSWRDDAIKYNKETGVFADPDAVREINFEGKFFKVPGPAITEPTPQRFPLLIQAGTSTKGKLFAAENAEIVFVSGPVLKNSIAEIRTLAVEKFGRDPSHIKFITPINPIIGRTHEEALEKLAYLEKYRDDEYIATIVSSVTGLDLGQYDWDDYVEYKEGNNLTTLVKGLFSDKNGNRLTHKTKKDIVSSYARLDSIVGDPVEVADRLEKLVEDTDLDGFNIGIFRVFPGELEDVVDLLIPELQKRGLFWNDYAVPGGTFRENAYGIKGQTFFPEDHPAYPLRWTPDHTKEQFDQHIETYKEELAYKRRLASK